MLAGSGAFVQPGAAGMRVIGFDRRGKAAGSPKERPRIGGIVRLDKRTPMMFICINM